MIYWKMGILERFLRAFWVKKNFRLEFQYKFRSGGRRTGQKREGAQLRGPLFRAAAELLEAGRGRRGGSKDFFDVSTHFVN